MTSPLVQALLAPEFALHLAAGGVAAAGFGVLFNFAPRSLLWCLAMGVLAVGVRKIALSSGLALEGASLLAGIAVGVAVQIPHRKLGLTRAALAVAGCIPLVPGGFIARAIIGLFTLTTRPPDPAFVAVVLHDFLAAVFTLAALGVGVSLSLQVFRRRGLDL
ncbi:threonine/serine exporter family protein [Phaeovibrio sulfidiphilus]|uniref:Threonine/serine exporter family protein n=1 Tax=Phaeovibrio sulfidiphilus TaxID=1220600 RepID=A0A8J6YLN7_9PROT|nr:threonine/serine exporter family protein [Phaeovibrio sulfidiphilus]MBE1236054.1 threonine/serine exporter family protein [Phaeovibrio sulfidiphilus]